jgi:hypothetical protein
MEVATHDPAPAAPVPAGPVLPSPTGPISETVLATLGGETRSAPDALALEELAAAVADPLGDDDLHLALYVLYELHYRGFAGVADRWEWDPGLLAARAGLERRFLAALEETVEVPVGVPPERVPATLFELEAADDAPPLSRLLERTGTLEQFREFAVHRSAYQLKEADPHSFAIPRLTGTAKAALLEVQSDEYGAGEVERMHSRLFAKTMRGLGLDDREGAYLGHLPGTTLATVNLMSCCGLRRELRGAIVGHLAMFEMTSARPNRRYGNGLRRLGLDRETTDFYDEHVEADSVHEHIAAHDLAGGLAAAEPELSRQILCGAAALLELEGRFAAALLAAWEAGESSLRRPLDG